MKPLAQARGVAPPSEERLPVRKLVAASIGNAVEWYDWTIYATFSIYFASAIFPGELALVNTLATFALAFFFRPLGGALLGRFSDIKGRRPAMLLTITMMAGGSLVIACLPTFEMVGWLAPILLLLARISQGMSVGGEVSSASVYLAEIAPPHRRGRFTSFQYISTGVALLIATGLGLALSTGLSDQALNTWGWRVPFLIGAILGVVGLWLRRSLAETDQFAAHSAAARATRDPLRTTLREHPRAVAQLVGFTLLSTLCYYTFFSALTPFAVNSKGADDNTVFLALTLATVVFLALQYPAGWLSDRFGRKPQMLVWAAAIAVLVVPLSALVGPNFWGLLTIFTVGLALYSLMTSLAPAIMSELFPTKLRALGIGAWYNLTVATFGGTAPLIITALAAAGMANVFFWYVAGAAVVGFLAILSLPETRAMELH